MIHKYTGIGRRTNSSHGTAFYLYVIFTVYCKLFKVRINDTKMVITFLAIAFLEKFSSDIFTAFIPSQFRIFAYKDFTCSDAGYEWSGTAYLWIHLHL